MQKIHVGEIGIFGVPSIGSASRPFLVSSREKARITG